MRLSEINKKVPSVGNYEGKQATSPTIGESINRYTLFGGQFINTC